MRPHIFIVETHHTGLQKSSKGTLEVRISKYNQAQAWVAIKTIVFLQTKTFICEPICKKPYFDCYNPFNNRY